MSPQRGQHGASPQRCFSRNATAFASSTAAFLNSSKTCDFGFFMTLTLSEISISIKKNRHNLHLTYLFCKSCFHFSPLAFRSLKTRMEKRRSAILLRASAIASSQGSGACSLSAHATFPLDNTLDRSKLILMDSSSDNKYRQQILEAWGQLAALERFQRVFEAKISDTRELIRALANFLSDNERAIELLLLDVYKHPTNITEAVRVALYVARMKNERLTPVQIKELAEARGFDFAPYTNPMASIHSVLKRMRDSGTPEVTFNEDDSTYTLNDPLPTPAISPELLEEYNKRFWMRLASVQEVDSQKTSEVSMEIYTDVFGKAFEKARRKRLEE